jgi:hypothetical protein
VLATHPALISPSRPVSAAGFDDIRRSTLAPGEQTVPALNPAGSGLRPVENIKPYQA